MYRPKKCMSCGGTSKLQKGGFPKREDYGDNEEAYQQAMTEWMGSIEPTPRTMIDMSGTAYDGSQPDMLPISDAPAIGAYRAGEFDREGLIEKKKDSFDDGKKLSFDPKVNDFDPMAARIGLHGLSALANEISGRVERGRQNQYDYQQQTALGQMKGMPVRDFQPTAHNQYAQEGGAINPFNQYLRKGGNLKTIMKEYQKFSNNAQMDMGDGQLDDQGRMQYGGKMKNVTINNLLAPQSFTPMAGISDEFEEGQLRNLYSNSRRGMRQMRRDTRKDNLPISMQMLSGENEGQTGFMHNGQFTSNFLGMEEGGELPEMKKGGYEIDRMYIMRNGLPQLFKVGRMGTGKYRGMQGGGPFSKLVGMENVQFLAPSNNPVNTVKNSAPSTQPINSAIKGDMASSYPKPLNIPQENKFPEYTVKGDPQSTQALRDYYNIGHPTQANTLDSMAYVASIPLLKRANSPALRVADEKTLVPKMSENLTAEEQAEISKKQVAGAPTLFRAPGARSRYFIKGMNYDKIEDKATRKIAQANGLMTLEPKSSRHPFEAELAHAMQSVENSPSQWSNWIEKSKVLTDNHPSKNLYKTKGTYEYDAHDRKEGLQPKLEQEIKKTVKHLPRRGKQFWQKGGSIVDYLTSKGIDSSMENRKKLFSSKMNNYTGTAAQNMQMLKELQTANTPKGPTAPQPQQPRGLNTVPNTSTPIPKAQQVQQEKVITKVPNTSVQTPKAQQVQQEKVITKVPNTSVQTPKAQQVQQEKVITKVPNTSVQTPKAQQVQQKPSSGNSQVDSFIDRELVSKGKEKYMIVDKAQGWMYYGNKGEHNKIRVGTGQNNDVNATKSVEKVVDKINTLDSLGKHSEANKLKITATGSKPMKYKEDIYGKPGFRLEILNRESDAELEGMHVTYPADAKRRLALLKKGKTNFSYGCTNVKDCELEKVMNMFSQDRNKPDTAIYIDTRRGLDENIKDADRHITNKAGNYSDFKYMKNYLAKKLKAGKRMF